MNKIRKSTMIELVEELKKLPKSKKIDFMIEEAETGEYHDFKNRKYACGKIESSCKLRLLGYAGLAKRIESGEFDEECDDIDKQMLRNYLGEGAMADDFKKLLGL